MANFDTNAFRGIIGEVARRTPPQEAVVHSLLKAAYEAASEIEAIRVDAERAWGDADQMARREFSAKAMQSILIMTGIEPDGEHRLRVAGKGTNEDAMKRVRDLARKMADVMLEEDRKDRKDKPL